ncbi:hypothetical protein GWK47_051726 [Chionoecetes opilio]|uniref:Uncharacterized protein n=1 Tax=Chionoecetes opilio TaxID=41210 RepID=A0A8J5CBX4_CHIOP|nr:hypothetical protein GWK47_051726 [Chionoecetes opilio]
MHVASQPTAAQGRRRDGRSTLAHQTHRELEARKGRRPWYDCSHRLPPQWTPPSNNPGQDLGDYSSVVRSGYATERSYREDFEGPKCCDPLRDAQPSAHWLHYLLSCPGHRT